MTSLFLTGSEKYFRNLMLKAQENSKSGFNILGVGRGRRRRFGQGSVPEGPIPVRGFLVKLFNLSSFTLRYTSICSSFSPWAVRGHHC